MTANPRLAQISRMLGGALASVAEARRLVESDPTRLAGALVREAADSDDVTSAPAAMDYLESRLADLAEFFDAPTAAAIRQAFAARVAAWGPPSSG